MRSSQEIIKERPFYERYFDARRFGEISKQCGNIALKETVGLEDRFEAEIISGFSEALDGRVVADYSFGVENGQIVAEDGEALEVMMLRARKHAYELAAQDPRMQFVVDRFEAELGELHLQQKMIRPNSGFNAILTVSPMTFELSNEPTLLKAGYQRPDLNRSLLRLSYWDGSRIRIITRSLDNSTMDLLSSALTNSGLMIESSSSIAMLLDRKCLNLGSVDAGLALLGRIISNYDIAKRSIDGQEYSQGIPKSKSIDLLKFIYSHPEIIRNLKKKIEKIIPSCDSYEQFKKKFEQCLYDHLSLYAELVSGGSLRSLDIDGAVSGAGKRAADSGKTFSLCGEVIKSEANPSERSLLATGFESLLLYSGKKVQCPNKTCRKFVVVSDKYLKSGILHCKECKHTIDVCGDDKKAAKIKQREQLKAKKEKQKAVSKSKKLIKNNKDKLLFI